MLIGKENSLNFEIVWNPDQNGLARGELRAQVGQSNVWSDQEGEGIDWTWIELLEQLSSAWGFLKYEEHVPLEIQDNVIDFLSKGFLPDEECIDFASSRDTYMFNRRHNLATGIDGLFLPSFSFLKEGNYIWVVSENVRRLLDFQEIFATLGDLGDAIRDQLKTSKTERAKEAVSAWESREPSFSRRLQIQLIGAEANSLVPEGVDYSDFFEVAEMDEAESAPLVFARMSAPIPLEVRRQIIGLIKEIGPTKLERLDRLSDDALSVLSTSSPLPYKQGYELARWARREFDLQPHQRAEPDELLTDLGIQCKSYHWESDEIDAVGCWDVNHGPAVLINLNGRHARSKQGRRATYAHELAHLLVDRSGSLPVAEVFGGYAPLKPEQRARAFAAEFLLPHEVVDRRIREFDDARKLIKKLQEQFDVSIELAAWHIQNCPSFNCLSLQEKVRIKKLVNSNSEYNW